MEAEGSDGYVTAGYESADVGFGERPGIVVVDFQNSHVSADYPFGGRPLAMRAFDNTRRLLQQARPLGIPVAVCYTAYQSDRDMPYWKIRAVKEKYFHGNDAVKLDPRIVDPEYDYVVCKTGPSIFYETGVQSFFTKQRVDTVIITGVNTSGCIRATAIDSFQRGYRTIVPEDCVGDVEEGPHHDNLRDIRRRYVDVVDLAGLLEYFESLRGRNER
jgi:maleamate amidohydrolase